MLLRHVRTLNWFIIVYEILDELMRQHGIDSGVSFQDFLNFDNTIETSGSLTDEEIASMVHEGHATQNDSEETSEQLQLG